MEKARRPHNAEARENPSQNQADALRRLIEREFKTNEAIRKALEFIEEKILKLEKPVKPKDKEKEVLNESVTAINNRINQVQKEMAAVTDPSVKQELGEFIAWLEQNRDRWLSSANDTQESAEILKSLKDQCESLLQLRQTSREKLFKLYEKEDKIIREQLQDADSLARHSKEEADKLIGVAFTLPEEQPGMTLPITTEQDIPTRKLTNE